METALTHDRSTRRAFLAHGSVLAGAALLLVTHDPALAARAQRAVTLRDGCQVEPA